LIEKRSIKFAATYMTVSRIRATETNRNPMINKIQSLRATIALLPFTFVAFISPGQLQAHCEVPCGIFADELRFEAMLEDQKTIAKSIDEIAKHLATEADQTTALAVNQIARWISTKEEHAENIQHTMAQYFMAQRIKPAEGEAAAAYVKKLTAAHAVMQSAMKAKQDAAPETATALRSAILDFYRAYEGKEPSFD
jgi:nickel superoxide dismutase